MKFSRMQYWENESLNMMTITEAFRHIYGKRVKERDGAYWLDGRPLSLAEVYDITNRVMVSRGQPPFDVPEPYRKREKYIDRGPTLCFNRGVTKSGDERQTTIDRSTNHAEIL